MLSRSVNKIGFSSAKANTVKPIDRVLLDAQKAYFLSDALCFCYFVVYAISQFISYSFIGLSVSLLTVAGLASFVVDLIKKKRINGTICTVIVLFVVSWWMCRLFRLAPSLPNVDQLVRSICSIGIAFNLVNHRHRVQPYTMLYFAIVIVVLFKLVVAGNSNQEILQSRASRNYISVYLLLYFSISNYIRIQNASELSLIQSILFLIVAILSYGRGGITTAFVLTGCLLMKAIYKSHSRVRFLYSFGLIILVLVVVVFWDNIAFLLSDAGIIGKYSASGIDNSARFSIWSTYLDDINSSANAVLFGADQYHVRIDGNLHNTLLQLHSSYGLFIATGFSVILLFGVIDCLKKKNFDLAILIIVFVIRASTDSIAYPGMNEIMLLCFVLHLLLQRYSPMLLSA